MFRSRNRIRQLTEDLYSISNMLNIHTIQRLKIYIWVYCLLVTCGTACFEVAILNSINILADLFWLGYSFAFTPSVNNATSIFVAIGFIQYFCAAADHFTSSCSCQRGCGNGEETVLSLPGWFPKQYSIIKMHVRRRFMPKTTLTLWKIYRIDKSLLISAIGTLISYGILVGTLGSVQNSNNES
ncbi:uncharacterized protein CEXT_483381 [Caerostris extrusa]|uniref:Uncharacterized protein n=1 Tax=Caerostris extrusa TaxID=172846 RepID=A0AAV4Y083_CAEEX|nr:uncharacterized protein CEXT_483381 [Caerostris extrusa]